jgi:hypothetical protein
MRILINKFFVFISYLHTLVYYKTRDICTLQLPVTLAQEKRLLLLS